MTPPWLCEQSGISCVRASDWAHAFEVEEQVIALDVAVANLQGLVLLVRRALAKVLWGERQAAARLNAQILNLEHTLSHKVGTLVSTSFSGKQSTARGS